MSAFGEGYKLPKKGKKKNRHRNPVLKLDSPTATTSSTTASTTRTDTAANNNDNNDILKKYSNISTKKSSSKSKRPIPHPPSPHDLEDSSEFQLTADNHFLPTLTPAEKLEETRRQKVMNAMLNEIGDVETSPKHTSSITRKSDTRSNNVGGSGGSGGSGGNSNTEEDQHTIVSSAVIHRTASEEFGTQFHAASAGRVTVDSPLSTRSEKSEKSNKSHKSSSSSLLGRLRGHSKKKKTKKRTRKKSNGDDTEDTESDTDTSDDDIDGEGDKRGRAESRLQMEDLDRTRKWLNTPCRRDAKNVQCYVTRQRAGLLSRENPFYRVFMEETNEFVMAGKKRLNKRTSNYLITMNREKVERSSHMVVGKVRSNASGSIYHVYDQGLSSKNSVSKGERI